MEFPEDGIFNLADVGPGSKYVVCGDNAINEEINDGAQPGPSRAATSASSGWAVPHAWTPSFANQESRKCNPLTQSRKALVPFSQTAAFKRTFPYVTLCLDHTGKNVAVEFTIDSIYVKLPEESVCVRSVLEKVSTRVGLPADDLVLLDAKFIPVSNEERGESSLLNSCFSHIMPSSCRYGVLESSKSSILCSWTPGVSGAT